LRRALLNQDYHMVKLLVELEANVFDPSVLSLFYRALFWNCIEKLAEMPESKELEKLASEQKEEITETADKMSKGVVALRQWGFK